MALFNPTMGEAPNTFRPVGPVQDNSTANALKAAGGLLQNFAQGRADQAAAEQEAQNASATAGLFSDTLRTEAEIIQGQEALTANQRQFDQLYSDGVITDEERGELSKLQQERARLENVTNPRARQVQLRMKYANFVNRFPHLTKEARIMFGDADTRLDDVAQGSQGLVDQEAFEEVYGKDYSAGNISTFRNMQRYNAQRKVGTVRGTNTFQDWSTSFKADVTTNLYAIGKKINTLAEKQGALRQEDIETFNSSINEGYMNAVQEIDQGVVELQQNGMYVDNATVAKLKTDLQEVRDNMLQMSEGKDFLTKLNRLNELEEAFFEHNTDVNLSASTKLLLGNGAGGAKGGADVMTIKQVLQGGAGIDAAKNVGGLYGEQVASLQRGAVELMTYLDEYDSTKVREQFSPALTRHLAQIQSKRMDNNVAAENPEQAGIYMDVVADAGTSDELAEAVLSRAPAINKAANEDNGVKSNLSSRVNNYALETEQFLQDINGRIRQTPDGPEVVTSTAGGRFVRSAEGTKKLRTTQRMFKELTSVASSQEYDSLLQKYTSERNQQIQESVKELQEAVQGPQGVNTQLLSRNLRQLRLQFGLTDQEVAEISAQVRSSNGPEASRE